LLVLRFPQVIVGGTLVGGFQETVRADRSGQLQALLKAAA
jgi:glutaredoxin-related protein